MKTEVDMIVATIENRMNYHKSTVDAINKLNISDIGFETLSNRDKAEYAYLALMGLRYDILNKHYGDVE